MLAGHECLHDTRADRAHDTPLSKTDPAASDCPDGRVGPRTPDTGSDVLAPRPDTACLVRCIKLDYLSLSVTLDFSEFS